MSITVNDGGVLHTLKKVTVNNSGTLYPLKTVHSNSGGVLYKIFPDNLYEDITWEETGNGFYTINSVSSNGLHLEFNSQTSEYDGIVGYLTINSPVQINACITCVGRYTAACVDIRGEKDIYFGYNSTEYKSLPAGSYQIYITGYYVKGEYDEETLQDFTVDITIK